MTPPPKPKKPLIRIIEHSEKFKSKPTQIVCSQSRNSHHQVIDLRPYSISKRAAKRLKEKE